VFPAGLYFMLKIARGGPKDVEDPHAPVEGRQRQLPRGARKARATP
jgi:hypothetical protein